MDIEHLILVSAVSKAQRYLNDCSRNRDAAIHFELHAIPQNGVPVIIPLIADTPNPPAWGWPVLSENASIKTLQTALKQIEFNPKSILVAACYDDNPYHIILDLLCEDKATSSTPDPGPTSNLRILRRNEIAQSINQDESGIASDARVVMAVSVDTSMSLFDDRLGSHLRYAMDGTGTILWLGTVIDNYPSPTPEDVDVAVNKEIAVSKSNDTVLIVSGDIVDAGDGRALVKNAHHVDSAIVD